MLNLHTRKVVRPVVVALVVAVVAGTAAVLGLAAAADAWLRDGTAVIVALVAVWIPQALITAARHRRH